MGGLEIEVVTGPVEVHGEEHDAVQPVLFAVGLRLHEEQLLGDAVRSVGLLGIPVPQIVLAERHRCELGIGADGADGHHLLHAGQARLFQHVQAHHGVLEEEASRVLAVGADPAHAGGQVEDELGPGVGQQAAAGRAVDQIVVAAARDDDVAGTLGAQVPHQAVAEEAGAAGDDDAFALARGGHSSPPFCISADLARIAALPGGVT